MPVHEYTVAMTCGGCSGAVTRILTKQLDAEKGEKFKVREKLFKNHLHCILKIFILRRIFVLVRPKMFLKVPRVEKNSRLIWKTSLFSSRRTGQRMRSKKSLRNAAKRPSSKQLTLMEVFKNLACF